jgi:hypothetical protein
MVILFQGDKMSTIKKWKYKKIKRAEIRCTIRRKKTKWRYKSEHSLERYAYKTLFHKLNILWTHYNDVARTIDVIYGLRDALSCKFNDLY